MKLTFPQGKAAATLSEIANASSSDDADRKRMLTALVRAMWEGRLGDPVRIVRHNGCRPEECSLTVLAQVASIGFRARPSQPSAPRDAQYFATQDLDDYHQLFRRDTLEAIVVETGKFDQACRARIRKLLPSGEPVSDELTRGRVEFYQELKRVYEQLHREGKRRTFMDTINGCSSASVRYTDGHIEYRSEEEIWARIPKSTARGHFTKIKRSVER